MVADTTFSHSINSIAECIHALMKANKQLPVDP